MSTDANRALARNWFESSQYRESLGKALQHGDTERAREFFFRALIDRVFSPDCVMHFPDGDGTADRILRYHLVMIRAFPDLSSEIEDMVAEKDKVVVRGRLQGTNTGPFQGRSPTGNRVSMGFITICRVSEGKIAETWGYNDMPGFLRQLGIRPGS